MLLLAEQPHIRSVVLSSRWSNWRIGEPANPAEKVADVRLRTSAGTSASAAGNRPIFERAFIMLIDRLRHAGKSVVIVGPVPEPSYDVPHRAYVSQFGLLDPPAPLTLAEYNHRHATILKFFKTLDGKVLFIWPSEQLCNRGQCLTQENGIPLYFDHNHLSFSSAQNLSHLYDSLFTLRSGMPSGQANAPQPWSGQNVRHASKHSDFLPERRD